MTRFYLVLISVIAIWSGAWMLDPFTRGGSVATWAPITFTLAACTLALLRVLDKLPPVPVPVPTASSPEQRELANELRASRNQARAAELAARPAPVPPPVPRPAPVRAGAAGPLVGWNTVIERRPSAEAAVELDAEAVFRGAAEGRCRKGGSP